MSTELQKHSSQPVELALVWKIVPFGVMGMGVVAVIKETVSFSGNPLTWHVSSLSGSHTLDMLFLIGVMFVAGLFPRVDGYRGIVVGLVVYWFHELVWNVAYSVDAGAWYASLGNFPFVVWVIVGAFLAILMRRGFLGKLLDFRRLCLAFVVYVLIVGWLIVLPYLVRVSGLYLDFSIVVQWYALGLMVLYLYLGRELVWF